MRGPVFHGLEIAHDAIATVDDVMQLVAAIAESLTHLRSRPADDVVDVGDRVRVADADESDIAFADPAGAFQLDAEFRRRHKLRACDARRLGIELFVATR